jgi:hypothetical protein
MMTSKEAILIDQASDLLTDAIKREELALLNESDQEIRTYKASKRVLEKIDQGHKGLYDPNNSGDLLILSLAAMD